MSYFVNWIIISVGLFGLFWYAEQAISKQKRRKLTNWIKNLKISEALITLPLMFESVFDAVFGKRHISLRCFFRSCIASLASVIIITFCWSTYDWDIFKAAFFTGPDVGRTYSLFLIHTILLNLLPDYISLFETRKVIGWMSNDSKILRSLGFLFFDLILTFLIALITLLGSFELFALIRDGRFLSLQKMMELGKLVIPATMGFTLDPPGAFRGIDPNVPGVIAFLPRVEPGVFNEIRLPGGIWFYSTFFTSVWVWLYSLGSMGVKIITGINIGFEFIKSFLNIEEKPVLSIGLFCVVLISLGFMIFGVVRML